MLLKKIAYILAIYFLFQGCLHSQDVNEYHKELKSADSNAEKLDLYIKIGDSFKLISSFDSALYYYNTALKIVNAEEQAHKIANSINDIGIEYAKTGVYNKAIKCFIESLRVFEILGNKKSMADGFMNIGNILSAQGAYDKAISFYSKALNLNIDIGDKKGIMGCCINMGVVYTQQYKFEEASKVLSFALKIAENTGDKKGLALFYHNIGSLYSDQGVSISERQNATLKFKQANVYFYKALALYRQLKDANGEAIVLNNLSVTYGRQNLFDIAVSYADSSLSIAKKAGLLVTQQETYLNLYEIYNKLDKSKEALDYHVLYKEISDSIFNLEKSRQINELQIKYETEKKQKEISDQKIKIELLQKESEIEKYKRSGLVLIIFVIAVLSVGLFFYLRRKIKSDKQVYEHKMQFVEAQKRMADVELNNQKLQSAQLQNELMFKNRELEYKNQEIVNLGLHISEKNDFLRKIKEELIKPDNDFDRKGLNQLIDYNLKALEKERREFEAYVENISQSFFVKLREKIPDITKTEERLAVLLKLNLSSKEISMIFNITEKSVEMSRYRLRKKLDLNKEDNLVNALNDL